MRFRSSLWMVLAIGCSGSSSSSLPVAPAGGGSQPDDLGVPTAPAGGKRPTGASFDRDRRAPRGRSDAGVDAGIPDSGIPDSGIPDSRSPDLGITNGGSPDAARPDLATADAAGVTHPGGGPFILPPPGDNLVNHAAATPIIVARLLAGLDILDVSVDQGGGVWAVSSSTVYYLPPGRSSPFTYNQGSGLARGWYTWTDTWFQPGVYPVTFQSVAGGTPGEAVIGNIGAIGDRLIVNPSTGAVVRLDNMKVTPANTNAAEYPEHLKRVVAAWKTVVDLNGTYNGTAYLGGFHGYYAFHGLITDCNCLTFEEHQHYITDTTVGGGDARALAISLDGDVWQGDRDFVTLLPQRSRGPNVGLFDFNFTVGLDVFPGVRDEVSSLAVDKSGGVYVASDGYGLAYLAPATYAASFWSSATTLPQNHLEAVAIDAQGDVWVGAQRGGVARYRPATNSWIYHTAAAGLPSDTIHALYWDKLSASPKLYLATDNGVGVY